MRFAKGHGTQNDFVILPDPDGRLDLAPGLVAALCDRHAGIGADGVLRVVRTKALGGALPDGAEEAEWFMDYRNADGSVAEMCGNGVRVFARYLAQAGLVAAPVFPVATRAGVRTVEMGADGAITVDMGAARVLGEGTAEIAGRPYRGLRVSVGNPHLACEVDGPIEALDLGRAPAVDPAVFPDGVNVELYRRDGADRLRMRVHERGSGETRSCGTGIVAVARAAAHASGREDGTWQVTVPGGELTVRLDGGRALLTGPAVVVAHGELDTAALG
ncbi:diaminopimelate epimerase [Allonocardiopsis opalescens]|uniref:Diaminopimelate epimerase n=1 Tax=Allonocardiopsis opalescens TaxID=1144618 RepID=A0A2T0QFF5_9ACTN|nr:diaminopimelate epimerase [Allonocardiopsis opalescens]PRY02664.1 diaminopimelate epimerase [Allonocardiopsis opalescens]